MQFSTKIFPTLTATNRARHLAGQTLIVGLYEVPTSGKQAASIQASPALQALLEIAGADVSLVKALATEEFNGKRGTCQILRTVLGLARLVIVGLGPRASDGTISAKALQEAQRTALTALKGVALKEVWCSLAEIPLHDDRNAAERLVLAAREQMFRCDGLKSEREASPYKIQSLIFVVPAAQLTSVQHGLAQGLALANGIDFSKELGNLPGNICTPGYLANMAKNLVKEAQLGAKLKLEVLEQKQLQTLGMNAFLSVAKGSVQAPKLIVLHYHGAVGKDAAKQAPIVLVGKGITFDSGGISLKPGEGMDEMKYDMCGAAAVLGTLRAISEMQLPLNIIGLIPTCENMPSGNANKPGDIVKSMSGQSIEILNTDAEGRLILCDALTYSERFKPATVIDIATLTGACIIALGHVHSGLFTADEELAKALQAAGKASADTVWRLPLDEEYQEQLKSNFADIANIGGRPAGSVTAACFLKRFTKNLPQWAHLDIAGTAWKSGTAKGATGRPVNLLVEYLRQRAQSIGSTGVTRPAKKIGPTKPHKTPNK